MEPPVDWVTCEGPRASPPRQQPVRPWPQQPSPAGPRWAWNLPAAATVRRYSAARAKVKDRRRLLRINTDSASPPGFSLAPPRGGRVPPGARPARGRSFRSKRGSPPRAGRFQAVRPPPMETVRYYRGLSGGLSYCQIRRCPRGGSVISTATPRRCRRWWPLRRSGPGSPTCTAARGASSPWPGGPVRRRSVARSTGGRGCRCR